MQEGLGSVGFPAVWGVLVLSGLGISVRKPQQTVAHVRPGTYHHID